MAFFKKLKQRLFKSSSRLEEGLDAIVEDGGEAEEIVEEVAEEMPATIDVAPVMPEAAPEPEPDRQRKML